jgi:hypothetical protein
MPRMRTCDPDPSYRGAGGSGNWGSFKDDLPDRDSAGVRTFLINIEEEMKQRLQVFWIPFQEIFRM